MHAVLTMGKSKQEREELKRLFLSNKKLLGDLIQAVETLRRPISTDYNAVGFERQVVADIENNQTIDRVLSILRE